MKTATTGLFHREGGYVENAACHSIPTLALPPCLCQMYESVRVCTRPSTSSSLAGPAITFWATESGSIVSSASPTGVLPDQPARQPQEDALAYPVKGSHTLLSSKCVMHSDRV